MHSVLYKKQNVTGYIQYYKKMVGQTQRPWVRQNLSSCLTECQTEKKRFVNSEIAQIFIKHNAATKVLTFPTTDIGHPSFSWLGTGIFTWRKVRLNKVLYMKMLRKRCLKIFVLESPWKVLDFAQQKSVWTLYI